MNNDYNKADYSSIEKIIAGIDEKKLLLPEFQRNFTWSLEQSVDLFDSLARGIFIGPLIMAQPKFNLYCKEFNNNPRKGKGSRKAINERNYLEKEFERENINVLLDGQQRVTSIYRALKGSDKLYFVLRKPEDISTHSEEIKTIEYIIQGFSSEKTSENIHLEISSIYRLIKEDWRERRIEKEILNPAIDECNFNDELDDDLKDRYFELVLRLKTLFSMLISDKTLLSVFLLDMDLEKFCMFFERSNSRGISLNFIDIITAKIYVGFNLRKKIEQFASDKAMELDSATVE
ncbi:MAG TPA: DUF262 domain-containing protein, partial [Patescibacteria group bacterium]|nr:DUF262 domain-containing protein [Patescibacteria group bacterium]